MDFNSASLVISIFVFAGIIFVIFFGNIIRNAPRYQDKPMNECVRRYLYSGKYGLYLELFDFLMSFFASALYIADSYVQIDFLAIEIFMAVYFNFYLLFQFYISHDWMKYIRKMEVWIDILTIFPIYLTFGAIITSNSTSNLDGFLILKLFKVFRFVRLSKNKNVSERWKSNPLRFQVWELVARLLCVLFITAGLIQILASQLEDSNLGWTEEDGINFHDALYFVVITLSTVGYGDLSPETNFGRLVICALVLCFVIYLSYETDNVCEIFKLRSAYSKLPSSFKRNHMIISCSPNASMAVGRLLKELFHPDHGSTPEKVVILCPCSLDDDWGKLILHWKSQDNLYFLRGDAQNPEDLRRACTSNAKAMFILTDEEAKDTRIEDTKAIATFMIVKKRFNGLKIFLQVVNTAAFKHAQKLRDPPQQIVCTEHLKMMMLASASLWHGWPSVISNLIGSTSYEDDSTEELETENEHADAGHEQKKGSAKGETESEHAEAIHEQKKGFAKEIYEFNLGSSFAGQTFTEATLEIFKKRGITLFAALREEKVYLFPGDGFKIDENDQGFIIADDANHVETIYEGVLPEKPEKTATGEHQQAQRGPSSSVKNFADDEMEFGRLDLSKCASYDEYDAKSERAARRESLKVTRAKEAHVVVITQDLDENFIVFVDIINSELITKLKGKRRIVVLCPSEVKKSTKEFITSKGVEIVSGQPDCSGFETARVSEASLVIITKPKTIFSFASDIDAERTSNTEVIRVLMDILDNTAAGPRFLVELSDQSYFEQVSMLKADYLCRDLKDAGTPLAQSKRSCRDEGVRLKGTGDAVFTNLAGFLLARAYFDKDILNVIEAMLCKESSEFENTKTSICQVSIPHSFDNQTTFGELFSHLLKHYDALPMGIVRQVEREIKIITCPSKEFKISKMKDEIVCFCDVGALKFPTTQQQQAAPNSGSLHFQEYGSNEQVTIQQLYIQQEEMAADINKLTAAFENVQHTLREVQQSIVRRK